MIYTSNGYDLYALNSENGAPRWCNTIFAGNGRDTITGLTYSRGSLDVYTTAGDVTSFNAGSGALQWSNYVEYFSATHFTPPSVSNTTVYGGMKSIYALNTQDGSVRWHYSLPDQISINSTLVASNGGVYFSVHPKTLPQQMYALDAATGDKRWTFSLAKNEAIFGQPTAGEGIVAFPYVAHFPDGVEHSGLDVLDAQTGKLLWQKALGLALSGPGGNQNAAIANGIFYVTGVFPDNSVNAVTYLSAFDEHTGALRWSVARDDHATDGSLLVANNVLYTVYQQGPTDFQQKAADVLDARDAQTGQLLWHVQLSQGTGLLGRLFSLTNHLFIGVASDDQDSTSFLYAMNINTHKEDWYANISGDADKNDFSAVSIGG